MAGPIRIAILANGRQARSELTSVSRTASRTGQIIGKAGKLAAVGLGAGLVAASYGAARFATAAAEDETAAKLLERQLKASADATDAQVAATERYITKLSLASGVTDDELRPSLAKLVTATKDVDQAQRLNNLALDVSVARGKSLETVSLAIARAQQGQLTGLSRLGIKTKDAAGETLTFRDAIRQMSDEFGGAAAARADTMQGRLDRLKVRLAETGEAIGYRLLPPLADLADKALDGADTLAKFARVNVAPKLRDAARWYRENEDRLSDLASTIRDEAGPMLSDLLRTVGTGGREFLKFAGPLAQDVLPALGKLVELGADAVGVVADLPGPVKTFGIAVGIAAYALPALTTRLAAATTGLAASTTGLAAWTGAALRAETRSTALGLAALRMGGLAKQAAGPAGIGALVLGASQGESALGSFLNVAGGAAVGFSLGGPIGAVIGGAGAGLIGAFRALDDAQADTVRGMGESKPKITDFASTLDSVTAATTEATRALALQSLQERGALPAIATLGLNTRTVIDALLGRKAAQDQVNAAIGEAINRDDLARQTTEAYNAALGQGVPVLTEEGRLMRERSNAASNLEVALGNLMPVMREQTREVRTQAIANADLTSLFPQLRKGAIARIRTLGTEAGIRDTLRLGRQLKLVPRDLRTLLRVTGAVDSERAARRVVQSLEDVGKVRVRPNLRTDIGKAVDEASATMSRGAARIGQTAARESRKTRFDLGPAKANLGRQLGEVRGTASSGTSGIGTAAKTGWSAGFMGADGLWSGQVRSAVAAAIAAGRAEARAKSPSQATADLGRDLGRGLTVGLLEKRDENKNAGAAAIAAILEGVTGGGSAIDKALDKITALVRKRVDLKDDKAERRREAEILKSLRKRYAALRANGKAQDALESGNFLAYLKKGSDLYQQMQAAGVSNLAEAREHLKGLRETYNAYIATVRQSFIEFGNVTQLGTQSGKVTTKSLLADLRRRAAAATKFAALIDSLRGKLSATAIQQLIDAGPEGGLAAAEAIAAGGDAAVSEINSIIDQLGTTGGALGTKLADQYQAAGIKAAEGLVAGLEAKQQDLDRIARKLADALVDAIKRKLGIKSPSRIMRQVGTDTIRGLALGLDETYVRRQGERVSSALVKGVGQPALTAYLGGAGAAYAGAPVVSVRLTAQQLSQLQRGREIRLDLDAWDTANTGMSSADK